MGVMLGPFAVIGRKVRRRNFMIEWMVLLIQNTRADASRRKKTAQEKTPAEPMLVGARFWIDRGVHSLSRVVQPGASSMSCENLSRWKAPIDPSESPPWPA
jgi:hypothetical protein